MIVKCTKHEQKYRLLRYDIGVERYLKAQVGGTNTQKIDEIGPPYSTLSPQAQAPYFCPELRRGRDEGGAGAHGTRDTAT
eukprot:1260342-Pleurochrysis_carterae.AAC.2